MQTEQVLAELVRLRDDVVTEEAKARLGDDPRLVNLGHYLALRHHDIRPLQRQLAWRGLTSLGRLEGRVLPSLDAAVAAVAALLGKPAASGLSEAAFFAGETNLELAVDEIFGIGVTPRRTRIMVTLAGELADDREKIATLVDAGMDVARINCAHDDADVWRKLATSVRLLASERQRDVRVLMDLAGPKIRTSDVAFGGHTTRLVAGDRLRLFAALPLSVDATAPFAALVAQPEIVPSLIVGDRVRYNDGQMEGLVEEATSGSVLIRIERAKSGGTKLKPEKGLNFPDSKLSLSPLTAKDESDLSAVVELADLVGYSFVSRPEDLAHLHALLPSLSATGRTMGLIAKVERPEAVSNLPTLIAQVLGRRPFGLMIARGDLAAEIGFERLAEMQEEILWLAEAASVPVVWATQVLEGLVSDGQPSRGEMTDAAMAARAECVMLNKGPFQLEALALLDRLLRRMEQHVFKKTSTLRRLTSW